MKGGIPNPSSQPKFGPNPIPSGCLLETDGMHIINEKLHWLTPSGYRYINSSGKKKCLILLDKWTIFLFQPLLA